MRNPQAACAADLRETALRSPDISELDLKADYRFDTGEGRVPATDDNSAGLCPEAESPWPARGFSASGHSSSSSMPRDLCLHPS
jgi:hypothetical protein